MIALGEVERIASTLAVACNGGAWDTHYVEAQKDIWRMRVLRILMRKA